MQRTELRGQVETKASIIHLSLIAFFSGGLWGLEAAPGDTGTSSTGQPLFIELTWRDKQPSTHTCAPTEPQLGLM